MVEGAFRTPWTTASPSSTLAPSASLGTSAAGSPTRWAPRGGVGREHHHLSRSAPCRSVWPCSRPWLSRGRPTSSRPPAGGCHRGFFHRRFRADDQRATPLRTQGGSGITARSRNGSHRGLGNLGSSSETGGHLDLAWLSLLAQILGDRIVDRIHVALCIDAVLLEKSDQLLVRDAELFRQLVNPECHLRFLPLHRFSTIVPRGDLPRGLN